MARNAHKVKASHLAASVKDLENYTCPKCEFILQDAVQTTCGTRLCQDCAEEFFSKKTRDLSLPCCPRPDCGEKIAQLDFFPDVAVRRELKLLPVECQCGWKENFGIFCERHIEECSLICDLCNEAFPFIEYQSHVNKCSATGAPLPKSHVGTSQEASKASIGQHTGLVISHGVMVASAPPSSSFRIPQSHNPGIPPSTKRFALISNERSEFPDHKVGGTIGIGEIGVAEGGVKIEEEAGAGVQAKRSESLSVKESQEKMIKKIQMLENKVEQLENNQSILFDESYDTASRITIVESTFNGSFLWKIPEVSKRREDARTGKYTSIFSLPFYSSRYGYKMCLRLYILGDGIGKGTHMSLFFVVMKGEFDNILQWPFTHKVTFKLINQCGSRDVVDSFQPDPLSSSFQKPKSDMNVASGCPRFVSIKELLQEGFIVDDTIFIKVEVDTSNGVNQAP